MNRLLLSTAMLLAALCLSARETASDDLSPQQGYKYFFTLSGGCVMGHSMLSGHYGSTAFPSTALTTTHGYQVNRQLFLGAGSGALVCYAAGHSHPYYSIPTFAAVRYTPMEGRYSMVLGLRVGNTFGFGKELAPDGIYCSPSAGLRIALNQRTALNFTLSYVLQRQGVNTIYTDYRTTQYEYLPMHGLMAAAHIEF